MVLLCRFAWINISVPYMSEVRYLVTCNSLRGKNSYQKINFRFFLLPVDGSDRPTGICNFVTYFGGLV